MEYRQRKNKARHNGLKIKCIHKQYLASTFITLLQDGMKTLNSRWEHVNNNINACNYMAVNSWAGSGLQPKQFCGCLIETSVPSTAWLGYYDGIRTWGKRIPQLKSNKAGMKNVTMMWNETCISLYLLCQRWKFKMSWYFINPEGNLQTVIFVLQWTFPLKE